MFVSSLSLYNTNDLRCLSFYAKSRTCSFIVNSFRTSHYNGYNKKYIEFVQKNFGKRRGTLGYTIGVTENDIIMFTKIILAENEGKLKLSLLFEKFEERGLIFDRESKRKITELFEKMNFLEKRSDSGDAQYVKSVL